MSRRLQLALNVNDIDQAVAFYTTLFGTGPAKVRPGYANFAIAEPPLKLVLLENPGQGGSLNHLGVEVPDTGTVAAEQARLAGTGLAAEPRRRTPPAATPGRTSSGSRARRTASPGRSTRSWPTARPSTAKATARHAAAAPAATPTQRRSRGQPAASPSGWDATSAR